MTSSMNNQFHVLIAFFITGICIGILFDIFRIIRKTFKSPNILIYLEDFLFWILTGFLIMLTIFRFTTGEIRLYMIIILLLGSFVYFLCISKYFILVNSRILETFKSIIAFLFLPLEKLVKLKKIKKISKK